MHYAVINCDAASTALLLQHGADANCVDKNGWTPLHYLSRIGVVGHSSGVGTVLFDVAELLLDYGGQIQQKDNNGWNCIVHAEVMGNQLFVSYLMQRVMQEKSQQLTSLLPDSNLQEIGADGDEMEVMTVLSSMLHRERKTRAYIEERLKEVENDYSRYKRHTEREAKETKQKLKSLEQTNLHLCGRGLGVLSLAELELLDSSMEAAIDRVRELKVIPFLLLSGPKDTKRFPQIPTNVVFCSYKTWKKGINNYWPSCKS